MAGLWKQLTLNLCGPAFLMSLFSLAGGAALNHSALAAESADPSASNPSGWETWASEVVQLDARESFQMQVGFAEIPVRNWKIVVDGGDHKCDLSLLRVNGEELIYYKTSESRHEALIPWGEGEELMVVLVNSSHVGGFVISLLGPPRDQLTAAYSYHVNRSLDAYAARRRLDAEDQCRLALRKDSQDAVAKVLLAGFERDRHAYDSAAALVDEALESDLPAEMRTLALEMRAQLVKLRAPLPAPVREGLDQAEKLLTDGKAQEAHALCSRLLDGELELDGKSRSKILTYKGRALEMLDRNFEAGDAYSQALGHLFYGMENWGQAQGALTIAIERGLPSGLGLQAREMLQETERRIDLGR